MCCVRTSVILKNLFKSSFDLGGHLSTHLISVYLLGAAYLVMFRIYMTWTRACCCLVCSCFGWFTHCLISCVSLMVPVPVSHFIASPKKGSRLLLDHGFSDGNRFLNSDSVLSNCTADCCNESCHV